MRIPRYALLAAAVLVTGALVAPSSAAAPTTTNACLSSVPEPGTTEPVQICYSIHRPAGASKVRPVPLIFHSHGWGGSRTTAASSFEGWLTAGFGVLSFDQRGFGESGGKAHVEHPDFEGQDVTKLVDVVAGLDWVVKDRPGDPRIGAIGGSYGGGYQFVGAFTEMRDRGRTRFDALAPEITWWDLRESLAPQQTARTLWVTALYAAGAAAHTNTVHRGFAYGAATGDWPQGEAPGVVDLDAFFAKNGPSYHVKNGRKLDIPVLFGQGITDNLFPLHQGLKNFDRALTPRARAKSIFVGYNGGHVLPSAFPTGVGVAGDPCSKKLGGGSFGDLARKFMQRSLKRSTAPMTGFGRYHLATADGACVSVSSVKASKAVSLGEVATSAAAGVPVGWKLADGPISIAGTPTLTALVTALGADTRAFFALSVGTTPADAQIVQHNSLPWREMLPVTGQKRTIELPSVAVDVPKGKSLFLTASPFSDMFFGHGSRMPGAMLLQSTVVRLPVVKR